MSEYLEDELLCGLVRMASARTASVLKNNIVRPPIQVMYSMIYILFMIHDLRK